MNGATPAHPHWRTSTHSTSRNQCVEVAALPSGGMAVRDSKNRAAGTHIFAPAEWSAFVAGVKIGELDFSDNPV